MSKWINRLVKQSKRPIALLLAISFLLAAAPQSSNRMDISGDKLLINQLDGERFVSSDNGFIKYYVDRQTGGFYILPSDHLLDKEKAPSFGSFRIDDIDVIFGGDYPNSEFVMPATVLPDGTAQTVWLFNELYITQLLNIIKNEAGVGDSYAVYIRYEVESAIVDTMLEADIEGRILLDTMFGHDDDLPVTVAGGLTFITTETSFTGKEVPVYYDVDSTFYDVTPRAYGLLVDNSVTTPAAFVVVDFDNVKDTAFDYAPDESHRVTDSAVLLYYDDLDAENDVVYFAAIYGFDELSGSTVTTVGRTEIDANVLDIGTDNVLTNETIELNGTKEQTNTGSMDITQSSTPDWHPPAQ